MIERLSLKIVGASGQGINSIGEILAKGLKRSGYCVFGYREYPSLIKGGHASYQLDFSPTSITSSERTVDLVLTLNHHGLEENLTDLKPAGILVHSVSDWQWSVRAEKYIEEMGIAVVYIPVDDVLARLKAKPILSNVILSSFVWGLLNQKPDALKQLVTEQFGHKKDLLQLNMQSIDAGFEECEKHSDVRLELPKPNKKWVNQMLITGSQAMGLGIIHGGARVYAGYPMTPSSPLLSFIAEMQNETGMVIKQAEDEITAAQMMSGAMHAGTRAITATSGGGFDLMAETVSLDGIIENPSVFVLAQRPGPATGLPTWTAQGDLMLAIHSGHGEFARCVMAVSDSSDSFSLMPEAFNIAEEIQSPVIVLTDKHIAEALYTQAPFDQKKTKIRRGKLVTDAAKLAKLKSTDRYSPKAKDGISPRWLPGSKAETYCAQGDEHDGAGTVDESAVNASEQMEKRMRKMEALEKMLPDPVLYVRGADGAIHESKTIPNLDLLIVGWGSTKTTVFDLLLGPENKNRKIGYMHITYLWPLKKDFLVKALMKCKKSAVIECNFHGQLHQLIKQQTGLDLEGRVVQYDGRPLFIDDLVAVSEMLLSE